MKSDKKNRSLEELNSMIEKDSSNPNNYFNRAIYYFRNSKKDKDTLEKVLKDINKAIEIDNQNARYYFAKGLIIHYQCLENHKLDQQTETMLLKNFDIAIELNPNNAEYYYWRGIVKNDMCLPYDDTDPGAIDDFEKAVQIDPKKRKFWIQLGDSCRSLGRDNRAIEAYTKAIEIEPSTSLLSKRGHLYYLLEEYDKAIRDFSIILKEKKTADHLYYRAKSYLKADMIDNALEDFSDSLQLYDNSTSEFSGNEKVYCIWNIYVFMSFIYLIKKEPDLHKKYLQLFIESAPKISYNEYSIEVFLTNPEHEVFSSEYVEDSIEALWMSCRLASVEQFCNIWKILCGNSDLGPLLPWESEDEIIKYMEDPQNESTASTSFLERINSILKIKFPQIKSNHSPSMIFSNLLNTYSEKGQELYFLIIKSLILEYFFADSIIPWQSVSDGEEVHDDAKTPLRKLKNKKEDRNILVFRNKIYLGILTKLNERIFQITEDKRREEEDEKKEDLARQAEAHRLEKERMIQQYSHTLANTLNPNTIYEVANHLKKHAEFRKDACFLTDAYHAETLIRNQGLLLQARNTGSPAEFQQLIRGDRLSEDTKEKAIGIEEILNHAIERIVARFLNADYRKLELIRTQICARRGTTLGELKADFEENVFFNPNRSAIEWANANLSRIEYTLSPLWNSIHLRRDGFAEALLQGYFQELLFNALKYRDSEQDIWINIRFYQEEIESRTFLVCDWENPYTHNLSISTGKGLEGIQNDLEMLNDIREKDKVFTWREENGKFRVTFRFLKDIFVPYKPKTELDSELLAKQLNKEKNDEHSLD